MPFPAPLTLRIFSFGSLKVHRRKTRSLSEAARIQPLRFPHFSSPPFPPRPLRAASEHRVPHARTGAALTHRRPHAPPPPPPALQFCSLISTFPSIFFLARQRSAVTRLERAACGKERRRRERLQRALDRREWGGRRSVGGVVGICGVGVGPRAATPGRRPGSPNADKPRGSHGPARAAGRGEPIPKSLGRGWESTCAPVRG